MASSSTPRSRSPAPRASRGHHESSPRVDADAARGSDGQRTGPSSKSHGASDKVHAAAALPTADITGSIVWGNSGNDVGLAAEVTFSHDVLGTIAAGIVQTDAGGNLTGVDPLLGPLQNNGGPTETRALLPGSPAKDVGPDPVPEFPGNEFDQRGPVSPGSSTAAPTSGRSRCSRPHPGKPSSSRPASPAETLTDQAIRGLSASIEHDEQDVCYTRPVPVTEGPT